MSIDPDSFARLLGTLGNKMPPPLVLVPGLPKGGDGNGAPAPTPAHDDYDAEERLAIQSEDSLPPDRGWDDVPGFEGMLPLAPSEHGAILHRLVCPAQKAPAPAKSTTDATQPARVDSGADMARPERVTCGSCARFQPGPQPLAIGVCLATANGLPPAGSRGYEAAFPMAPRSCPEFLGLAS